MVSSKNNVPAILNALERGAFYSSCGPELHDFYVENGKAHVVCSPAVEIVLRHLSTPYLVQRVIPGQPDLTHAGFDVYPERQQYVRAVVTYKYGLEGCEGGSFSERSSSLALPPEERLALGGVASAGLVPPEGWARFLASWLCPRRLTEPPRTCGVWGKLDRKKANGVCHWLSFYRRIG